MPKRRKPSREDYTVGWVCALPIELTAAQEMLDEELEDLDHDVNDTNIYTLGRISEHHVVIACLPAGQTGTNSAAAVAFQMKSAFSSIRFYLMVGIGGGVPSEEADIRLGDVVVSQPCAGHGGVVQYDFGKATPDGFKRTGHLNAPPAILLNAVTKVQANHMRRRSRLSEYMSKLNRLPVFARESAGADILFDPDYDHVGGVGCELCSRRRVRERPLRSSEDIVIHYGTIASGNQVMRDGVTRDKVSEKLDGTLCFEMEAAGMMNSFPCLVIRGICDYSDSHKNKKWQSYAAGTAAAYGKELLSVIPTAEVTKLRTADEIIIVTDQRTLSSLPYAHEASFNSSHKQHEPTCLPNTRVELLQEIYKWADGQYERCIFWLNGLAGTGKSTIARTVARTYFEQSRLGASFFFSRGGGDVSRARKFVTTIAVQLANNIPAVRQNVCEAIAERSDIASQSLRDQWHHLVLRPLLELDANGSQSTYVLVVDALDECIDDNNIKIILQILAEARSLPTVRLRIFLTSRPEIPIRHGFGQIPDANHQVFILHSVLPSVIDHDIRIFLEHNLRLIRQERSLDSRWPGEDVIRYLVQQADGLFIWAATACRFIHEGKQFAVKRLGTIIKSTSNTVTAPEKHLDEMYTFVLKHSISPDYTDEERVEFCGTLRHILGSLVVLLSPLSVYSLSSVLHVPNADLDQMLEDLHAILDIPEETFRPLRLHHPSFRDFLLNKERCEDNSFWVDEKEAHLTLANDCIQLMSSSLKQDICRVGSWSACN